MTISTECKVPVRERDWVYQSGQDTTAQLLLGFGNGYSHYISNDAV